MYEEQVKQFLRFEYLGIPFNYKGIDIAGLCIEGTTRVAKTANLSNRVGCDGTGVSPMVGRWILTSLVRPQMEYGLGATYLEGINIPDACLAHPTFGSGPTYGIRS